MSRPAFTGLKILALQARDLMVRSDLNVLLVTDEAEKPSGLYFRIQRPNILDQKNPGGHCVFKSLQGEKMAKKFGRPRYNPF
jgi:hypothetical protein